MSDVERRPVSWHATLSRKQPDQSCGQRRRKLLRACGTRPDSESSLRIVGDCETRLAVRIRDHSTRVLTARRASPLPSGIAEEHVKVLVKADHSSRRPTLHYLAMKVTQKQTQAVRCPTCGAKPRERCELSTGQPRTEPHRDRRLAASDR
jgi:hypothetical protein